MRDRIALDKMIGTAVHPVDADSIARELLSEFQRAAIPLYDFDGNIIWAAP